MKGAVDPRKRYPYICEDERDLPAAQQTVVWLSCRTAQELDEERAAAAASVSVGRHNKVKVDQNALAGQREDRWTRHVHAIARWRWQDGTVDDLIEDAPTLARVFREGDTEFLEEIDEAIRSLSQLEEGSRTDLDWSRRSPLSDPTASDPVAATLSIAPGVNPPDA